MKDRLVIKYAPHFFRKLKKLELDLQEEVFEKLESFADTQNHKSLKVHKLKGDISGLYSFFVNYKIRIVFSYLSKDEVVLLVVGGHDMYK